MADKVRRLGETMLASARFRLTRTSAEIEESDGSRRRLDHEIYHIEGAAAVLLYDPARRVALLVRQFRLPVYLISGGLDTLEVPAGMLDGEAPDVCARREALEETGVRVRDLRHAFDLFPNPGATTETLACFVARYGPEDIVAAGGGVDADEWIERIEMDFDEALARIESGEIRDAKTVALLYYARAKGLL